MKTISNEQKLSKKLGYKFNDINLLQQALCHRSFGSKQSNERLEFLGDSVLNFIIAVILYKQNSELKEGELSRLRANLVNGKVLSELASELNIGEHLHLGEGEQKNGGATRSSILADAFEAIIGAIYLDRGIKHCETFISTIYEERLKETQICEKDPKTQLQELLQAYKLGLPTYKIQKIEGAAHAQIFYIQCCVKGIENGEVGIGSNRRQAEQDAAAKFLSAHQDKILG